MYKVINRIKHEVTYFKKSILFLWCTLNISFYSSLTINYRRGDTGHIWSVGGQPAEHKTWPEVKSTLGSLSISRCSSSAVKLERTRFVSQNNHGAAADVGGCCCRAFIYLPAYAPFHSFFHVLITYSRLSRLLSNPPKCASTSSAMKTRYQEIAVTMGSIATPGRRSFFRAGTTPPALEPGHM